MYKRQVQDDLELDTFVHSHTHIVQADGGNGQCNLAKIFGEQKCLITKSSCGIGYSEDINFSPVVDINCSYCHSHEYKSLN